jgi:hypothetical protein
MVKPESKESALIMAIIFGQGGRPDTGDDFVCGVLCRRHSTDRCPFADSTNAGLCGRFKQKKGDKAQMIARCLDHYSGPELMRLRRTQRRQEAVAA